MYAINKTNNKMNNKTNNNQKPCCKVCRDAGKSENEYTSHGLKNERGIIICPTLLEQSCRYCSKRGHTVKYCPTLSKNTKEDKKQDSKNEYIFKNKQDSNNILLNKNKKNNFFMALCDDSDDEENITIIINTNKNNTNSKVDNFPPLSSKKIKNSNITNTLDFKNIITITHEHEAKEKALKEEEEIFKRLKAKKINHKEIQVIAAPETIVEVVTKKRNWADVYSSDEEDDEEEEETYRDKIMKNYRNPYDDDDDF